jgi:AcrR family transcriptional regulator
MSGLRERKKAETRTALSWAAISLTVERGFDNVKVEDIAAAAGVSPRTFNNYFGSKAEAIASRHLDRSLRAADELRRRPAGEPLWRAITAAAVAQFEPGPEIDAMPVLDQAQWVAGLRVMVVEPALQGELLRAGAAAEAGMAAVVAERTGTDVRQDMYPHLVAAALTTATNVAMQHYLRVGPAIGMDTLLPAALAQIAAGLPPPQPTHPPRTATDAATGPPAGTPAPQQSGNDPAGGNGRRPADAMTEPPPADPVDSVTDPAGGNRPPAR